MCEKKDQNLNGYSKVSQLLNELEKTIFSHKFTILELLLVHTVLKNCESSISKTLNDQKIKNITDILKIEN